MKMDGRIEENEKARRSIRFDDDGWWLCVLSEVSEVPLRLQTEKKNGLRGESKHSTLTMASVLDDGK